MHKQSKGITVVIDREFHLTSPTVEAWQDH